MRFARVDGFATSVVAFTTDIPVLSRTGAKPFLFGPGSIHVAHTPKRARKKQLSEASIFTRI